jgi:hypothetical protein
LSAIINGYLSKATRQANEHQRQNKAQQRTGERPSNGGKRAEQSYIELVKGLCLTIFDLSRALTKVNIGTHKLLDLYINVIIDKYK